MIDLKKIYEENLVSLKIPALWTISKNNLLNFNRINFSIFDEEDFFIFEKIFCEYEIFHSFYNDGHPIFELSVRVFYISNSNYEISCSIANLKNKTEIFQATKLCSTLDSVVDILNKVHLNILYEIDDIYLNKNYQKIYQFL